MSTQQARQEGGSHYSIRATGAGTSGRGVDFLVPEQTDVGETGLQLLIQPLRLSAATLSLALTGAKSMAGCTGDSWVPGAKPWASREEIDLRAVQTHHCRPC